MKKIVAWLNLPVGRHLDTWCHYKVLEQDVVDSWPFPNHKEPA